MRPTSVLPVTLSTAERVTTVTATVKAAEELINHFLTIQNPFEPLERTPTIPYRERTTYPSLELQQQQSTHRDCDHKDIRKVENSCECCSFPDSEYAVLEHVECTVLSQRKTVMTHTTHGNKRTGSFDVQLCNSLKMWVCKAKDNEGKPNAHCSTDQTDLLQSVAQSLQISKAAAASLIRLRHNPY